MDKAVLCISAVAIVIIACLALGYYNSLQRVSDYAQTINSLLAQNGQLESSLGSVKQALSSANQTISECNETLGASQDNETGPEHNETASEYNETIAELVSENGQLSLRLSARSKR